MQNRMKIALPLAILLEILLFAAAFAGESVFSALFWQLGNDPAVAVLQGEYWGRVVRWWLLSIAPFVPICCFLAERIGARRAQHKLEHAAPPEFATEEERRLFYVGEMMDSIRRPRQTPWLVYAALCGLAVLVYGYGVLNTALRRHIEETERDLAAYHAGQPTVYEGPLLQVERQLRDGVRAVPDERFLYYDAAEGLSLRCAATLIAQPTMMQNAYTVTYLPETGTILTITDAAGQLRTAGASQTLTAPEGCWLYGDLAVPKATGVAGYDAFTAEQQALFDLLYAEVLSAGVAAGEIPTRSFDLPFPLEKDEFSAVLELYEASADRGARPTHGYRTDDGRIVRRAYCYGITYAK